jgi:hypothetical protein
LHEKQRHNIPSNHFGTYGNCPLHTITITKKTKHMKTIQIQLFKFDELNSDARDNAVKQVMDRMLNNDEIGRWGIDDCYLFEPRHADLYELFGEEYGKINKPILGNNSKVYFDTDRNRHLDADEGIIVNDEEKFLFWLGISKDLQQKISYDIRNTHSRYPDTIIDFWSYEDDLSEDEEEIIENATDKFSDHMHEVLNRIESSIEYYLSEEYAEEEIQANDYDFTEDGTIY